MEVHAAEKGQSVDREVCARLVSDCRSSDTGSLTVAALKQREAPLPLVTARKQREEPLLSVAAPSDSRGSVRRSRLRQTVAAQKQRKDRDAPAARHSIEFGC